MTDPAGFELESIARLHADSSVSRESPQPAPGELHPQPEPREREPGASRVSLPARDFELPVTLGALLASRASVREFTPAPVSLAQLGRLLFAAHGISCIAPSPAGTFVRRTVPSAGGLAPLELYIATREVSGLDDGLYRYVDWDHSLELRSSGRVHERAAQAMFMQSWAARANLIVFITGVAARSTWKYGHRGYRYMLLEAGHVGQNLGLAAACLSLGSVCVGGFCDAEIDLLLGVERRHECALYLVCVGWPAAFGSSACAGSSACV